MRLRRLKTLFVLLFLCFAPLIAVGADKAAVPAKTPEKIEDKEVLDYIDQVIFWYQSVLSIDVYTNNSRERILQETLRKSAVRVLSLGFDFARLEADSLDTEKADQQPETAPVEGKGARIRQAAAEADQKVILLQAQLDGLEKEPPTNDPALTSRKGMLQSELALAKEQQSHFKTLIGFFTGVSAEENGSLLTKITELARSFPEIQDKENDDVPDSKAPVQAANTAVNERKGILGLGKELIGYSKQIGRVNELQEKTEALRKFYRPLREQLRVNMTLIVDQGKAIGESPETQSNNPEVLDQQKRDLDGLTQEFQDVSAEITPLADQNAWIRASRRHISDWSDYLKEERGKILKIFLLKLGVLGLAVLIPFLASVGFSRAIRKYIRDTQRQRQMQGIRKTLLFFAIVLIIVLNLTTELGSFATFVGFATAGLAVALQSVILSVFAYFFFFGRYGIRIGDRVAIGEVTGNVVEIGLFRLYLMELNAERQPTGRIVSFPNSVLFQPQAFHREREANVRKEA